MSPTSTSEYSGKEVSRAGEILLDADLASKRPADLDKAMDVLAFWRSCHETPLEQAHDLLRDVVSKIDRRAVSARRLKRIPSIIRKLSRFKGMKLRSMQDIGGCRAILKNQKAVTKAVRALKQRKSLRIKDYIKSPKDDGYRGIHLIGDFSGKHGQKRSIEIQLRTKIQHSWATAVEIIDLFTGQAIKSSQGNEEWRKFFRAISKVFSLFEDIPNFDAMQTKQEVESFILRLDSMGESNAEEHKLTLKGLEEVYLLTDKLDIIGNFRAFAASLKITDDQCGKDSYDGYVILEIDVKNENLKMSRFPRASFDEAAAYYLITEKSLTLHPEKVAVLVSTDAVGDLKEAYPNYFADSAMFVHLLEVATNVYKIHNPSKLSRAFKKLFS